VWKGDLTTGIAEGDSSSAQRLNELQQLAQADQAERGTTLQLPAEICSVGICPAPRQLHRRAIGKAHDHRGLARGQDLERVTGKRMMAADDGNLGGKIRKVVLGA